MFSVVKQYCFYLGINNYSLIGHVFHYGNYCKVQSFAKVSNHMCKNAKMAFFLIFANFIGWQYIFVLFIAGL